MRIELDALECHNHFGVELKFTLIGFENNVCYTYELTGSQRLLLCDIFTRYETAYATRRFTESRDKLIEAILYNTCRGLNVPLDDYKDNIFFLIQDYIHKQNMQKPLFQEQVIEKQKNNPLADTFKKAERLKELGKQALNIYKEVNQIKRSIKK